MSGCPFVCQFTQGVHRWRTSIPPRSRQAKPITISFDDFFGVSFEHGDFLNPFDVFEDAIVASKDMGAPGLNSSTSTTSPMRICSRGKDAASSGT